MRSSGDALGRWRRDRMSRNAVRRRCEISPSGLRGGVRSSGFGEMVESCDVTGLRSTRLTLTSVDASDDE